MLYICPTPIGNLGDITIRTLETLQKVDEIYCEDTRHSIKLLNHYEIAKPLHSLHEHNEKEKSIEIIKKLNSGKDIAYISDAGMPGISDPGQTLICTCIDNGVDFTTLPGASAFVVALVSSGLSAEQFKFKGFLDRNETKKREQLLELSNSKDTVIIYESPNRTLETVNEIYDIFGNRNAVIAREISKKYEEYIRGSLKEMTEKLNDGKIQIKGEVVILVEGSKGKTTDEISKEDIIKEYKKNLSLGLSSKDAVKVTSSNMGIAKNKVYEISLKCKD